MTLKEHFFVSRLTAFNETFASVKEDGDFVIWWLKSVSDRLGVDVAYFYIKCVNLCETHIGIFWADNCAGQNKTLHDVVLVCHSKLGSSEYHNKVFRKGTHIYACGQRS